MKQMYRRGLALLLAVCMFGLIGCGGGEKDGAEARVDEGSGENTAGEGADAGKENENGNENEGSGNADLKDLAGKPWEQVLSEMPSDLRGTTITVYNWNPITEYPGAAAVLKDFTQQTGIEVEWKAENFDTYLSKLTSLVASGQSPDVVRLRSPLVENLLNLQPVSAAEYDFTDGVWDPWIMEQYSVDGQCYGLNLSNTNLASPAMLLYNRSLIDKYDLDDPYVLWKRGQWTYDKFVEIMRDYVAESGKDFACSYFDYSEITQMFGVPGPITFDGKEYVSLLGDSDFISATQKVADLKNTDHLLGVWKADEFEAGELLFWCGTAVYARRQNAYFQTLKEAGSLYAVPFPKVEGQEKEYELFSEVEAYGIPEGAGNPRAVPYFLRYFLDRNNYDMDAFFSSSQGLEVYDYCMGIENRLWTTLFDEQVNFYGSITEDDFSKQLDEATGAQVSSVLDSTGPLIDQRVKHYNEQLAVMRE